MAATFTKLKDSPFITNDEWNLTMAERARQSLIALACREFDLGGDREDGIDGTGARDARRFKHVVLPGADCQGFTARVRFESWTDDGGTTVTPKVYDITSSTDLVVGAVVNFTTPTEELKTFALPAFERKYKLMVTKSNANALVYCVAKIELLIL
jgi:hypothetical protein